MKLDVKKLLAKILTALDSVLTYLPQQYIVEEVSVPVSFSSQRYKSLTKDISKTGYTAVGVVGWNTTTVDWMFSQLYISGTTLHLYIFRNASTTASVTMYFRILYRKNL